MINVDGLPLFKSSDIHIWPILAAVNNGDSFMIALFCGSSKPVPVDGFFEDFLVEHTSLIKNGIKIWRDMKQFEIKFSLVMHQLGNI